MQNEYSFKKGLMFLELSQLEILKAPPIFEYPIYCIRLYTRLFTNDMTAEAAFTW